MDHQKQNQDWICELCLWTAWTYCGKSVAGAIDVSFAKMGGLVLRILSRYTVYIYIYWGGGKKSTDIFPHISRMFVLQESFLSYLLIVGYQSPVTVGI